MTSDGIYNAIYRFSLFSTFQSIYLYLSKYKAYTLKEELLSLHLDTEV